MAGKIRNKSSNHALDLLVQGINFNFLINKCENNIKKLYNHRFFKFRYIVYLKEPRKQKFN